MQTYPGHAVRRRWIGQATYLSALNSQTFKQNICSVDKSFPYSVNCRTRVVRVKKNSSIGKLSRKIVPQPKISAFLVLPCVSRMLAGAPGVQSMDGDNARCKSVAVKRNWKIEMSIWRENNLLNSWLQDSTLRSAGIQHFDGLSRFLSSAVSIWKIWDRFRTIPAKSSLYSRSRPKARSK